MFYQIMESSGQGGKRMLKKGEDRGGRQKSERQAKEVASKSQQRGGSDERY